MTSRMVIDGRSPTGQTYRKERVVEREVSSRRALIATVDITVAAI
jgi:hypothetical protein